MTIDLAPAAQRMSRLLHAVSEDQFDLPTPCPDMRLGDLVDHVGVFAKRFAEVARKETGSGRPPTPRSANLEPGWRDRIAHDLDVLADAWRDPAAWEGMTWAGGLELPGEIAGLVALDELVVHGWDIAVAAGLPYEPQLADVEAATPFAASFDAPRDGGLFGPAVPVPEDATPLERLLGLTGRDPHWRASSE